MTKLSVNETIQERRHFKVYCVGLTAAFCRRQGSQSVCWNWNPEGLYVHQSSKYAGQSCIRAGGPTPSF